MYNNSRNVNMGFEGFGMWGAHQKTYNDSYASDGHGWEDNFHVYNGNNKVYSTCINKKENSPEMSIVGIAYVKNRIIAFGDSKSTIFDCHGLPRHEVERGVVTKIFENQNFLMVTHGVNTIRKKDDSGHEYPVTLETWMEHNLKDTDTPEELFFKLYQELKRDVTGQGLVYAFYAILKECQGEKPYVIRAMITAKAGIAIDRFYGEKGKVCCYGGATQYLTYLDCDRHFKMLTEPSEFREYLEKLIHMFDVGPDYNPAGFPVQIRCWEHVQ